MNYKKLYTDVIADLFKSIKTGVSDFSVIIADNKIEAFIFKGMVIYKIDRVYSILDTESGMLKTYNHKILESMEKQLIENDYGRARVSDMYYNFGNTTCLILNKGGTTAYIDMKLLKYIDVKKSTFKMLDNKSPIFVFDEDEQITSVIMPFRKGGAE